MKYLHVKQEELVFKTAIQMC